MSLPGLPVSYQQGTIEGPTTFESPTSALQDISSPYVGCVGGLGSYQIPAEDITSALNVCRSWRNLAGRLTVKIFSPRGRASSNCRGKLGKAALNSLKVKLIYSACMQYYPLQHLETHFMADKEIRNAIDETCQKSRAAETENV